MNCLDELKKSIEDKFCGADDLIARDIVAGKEKLTLFFIDGLVDAKQLDLSVIKPLSEVDDGFSATLDGLQHAVTASFQISETDDLHEAVERVASGDCLLAAEGQGLFLLPVKKPAVRAVSEPPTAPVLKGPREGFVEDLKTNMVLIRRHLSTPKLVFRAVTVGRLTKTRVAVAYIDGVVNKTVLKEVERRIKSIDIDGIIDSSYIAKFLEARPYSIFKQVGSQEKPDIVVAKMLEGRVAILSDGSPIVLTVPFLLMEDFQSSSDYYHRTVRTTMLRLVRLLALGLALILPAIVVALQQHQFQMLPLKLLMTIISSVDGIPFSPLVEMLLALVLFEILNEASIRMPRYVGMAMSVVGAIVLGETAVNAGILSSLAVLVTALSAIGLYVIPDEVGTFGILRMFYVVIGGVLGLYGVVLAGMVTAVYLVNLDSYGVAYLAPLAPIVWDDLKDAIGKVDLKDMKTRPEVLDSPNKRRQK